MQHDLRWLGVVVALHQVYEQVKYRSPGLSDQALHQYVCSNTIDVETDGMPLAIIIDIVGYKILFEMFHIRLGLKLFC